MKVIFDFAKQQIGIEGDGAELVQVLGLVRDIAPSLPAINIVTTPPCPQSLRQESTGSTNGHDNGGRPQQTPSGGTQTLRQFVRALPLSNVYERITAVGYYQNKIVGVPVFSPKQMSDWFTQCGFQKPAQMPVGLSDARRRYGYIDNVGRAAWRVSTNGENLIMGKMEQAESGEVVDE